MYPLWQGFSFSPLWVAEAAEETRDQRRPCSESSLSHKSYCRFCRALVHTYRTLKGDQLDTHLEQMYKIQRLEDTVRVSLIMRDNENKNPLGPLAVL